MGNGYARLTCCCSGGGPPHGRRRHVAAAVTSEIYDDGLGHSFCYVRPDLVGGGGRLSSSGPAAVASSKVHHSEETTTFRAISGASVSANPSTPLSTAHFLVDYTGDGGAIPASAAFESSTSFSSVALQPVPRFSGPLSGPIMTAADRGFMSGPIERGFMSGPLDHRAALFSGPLEKPPSFPVQLRRSLSHGFPRPGRVAAAASLLRGLTKAITRTISATAPGQRSAKALKFPELVDGGSRNLSNSSGRNSLEGGQWSDSPDSRNPNLQWAQGKAGEDRIHVVVSEEHGWVFVGIYDGFNGPDATDYLLSNLYFAVHRELKGLLWEDKDDSFFEPLGDPLAEEFGCCKEGKQSSSNKNKFGGPEKKMEENEIRSNCEWPTEKLNKSLDLCSVGEPNHSQVLKALSQALRKTEEEYLEIADKMISENPELALMGSCVLVMLLKGDDVYLMNVGDSRALLAQKVELDSWSSIGKPKLDLHKINEDTVTDIEVYDGFQDLNNLAATQLTLDHSTCVEEEVRRIKNEHPDDPSAIYNHRVKGSLKVTRAFGAGFLKQPKWNNALLEMFRVDYVGTSPYITCNPFLHHHKLGPKDKFLILSSDGLYQYFTNEEAVTHLEMFIATTPEGDPAQHLVEEVLFRAAKKAGMDFHELLEIPQGDRRQYHDDVSIIVISLEGQIWRSCV
ncbi:putative protein phosphatase 2C 23 [Canna indica]|uniref:protein-serine/threonine phosphatase n=1 Tax=Canna indica TaxID=4628 RepID=A0AAQ3JX25_9LILI|nr:putative protein phosphatase 2C 23 [Canna indica]